MELGIYTFVERTPDPVTGETISAAQRLRNLLEEVTLADQLGARRADGARPGAELGVEGVSCGAP